MRKILGLTCMGLLFSAAAGCASQAAVERRDAQRHEYRAQRAASYGDYERAAAEQRAANIERDRAARHQYEENLEDGPRIPPPATPLPAPAY